MTKFVNLLNAKTIGSGNNQAWSRHALSEYLKRITPLDPGWKELDDLLRNNFQNSDYLNVLPQHLEKIPINSGWLDWQAANAQYEQGQYSQTNQSGTFFSSWGPKYNEVNIDLSIAGHDRITIDGFGEIRTRDEFSRSIYDNEFWLYNEQTPGPVIVADPGDTIRVKLKNNLDVEAQTKQWNPQADRTNLHLHGSHVSPKGKGDNVMIAVGNGDSQEYIYQIPENHPSGLLWMHPHLHGTTSLSLAGGAALPVFILPDEKDTNNLKDYDPTTSNIHLLSLQSWAVEQEINPNVQPGENNWENTKQMPPRLFKENGKSFYKYGSAPFNGNNYQPLAFFTDNDYWAPGGATYADYVAAKTTENLIHTVNGQYNPTINAKTNEWVTFGFLNFSLNSSHVIQLVHADEEGNLSLESPNLLGIDSDISRWASEYDTSVSTLPGLAPGGRITIQHSFDKPGSYYFISNASKEVLGDLAPNETNRPKNSSETYLGYNDGFQITPSQVLATVDVSSAAVKESKQPNAWDYLVEQRDHALGLKEEAASKGVNRTREFVWNTNALEIETEKERKTMVGPNGETYIDPGYNDPEDWEGVWTINQQYWTHKATQSPTITIAMLDTLERWSLVNSSKSSKRDTYPKENPRTEIQIGQSHPFHLHQNEFIVESINGLKVGATPNQNEVGDAYVGDSLVDVYQMGPAYAKGSATPDNPFGTPMILDEDGNYIDGNGTNWGNKVRPFGQAPEGYLTNSKTDILIRFEDFTGLFVDHCHLLFHEDGGMMVPVLTILNTNDSWITSGSANNNSIQISLGSNRENIVNFQPFSETQSTGVNVASGDINALNFVPGPKAKTVHVSDNIEDIAVIEATSSTTGEFKLNVFDGQSAKDFYAAKLLNNNVNVDSIHKLKELKIIAKNPRNGQNLKSSIAVGDINGDGYDEIVVGISGNGYEPEIRVYSGETFKELYCLSPFDGAISNGIDIEIGDLNGDNYGDIIVSQLEGGQGLVDGFDGKKLTDNNATGISPKMLSEMSKLWKESFNPHGKTKNGIRIAVGYSLPDEQPTASDYKFTANMHNQTFLANLTTLEVKSDAQTTFKNWLYDSKEGAHAGHGVEDKQSAHNMMNDQITDYFESQQPREIISNGTFDLGGSYNNLEFHYFDINSSQRGEGGLLLTQANGGHALLHLKTAEMNSSDDFDFDAFTWSGKVVDF